MKKNKHIILLLSVIMLLLPLAGRADTKDAISGILVADSAYNAGDYAGAIEIYENVMEMHGVSASSLFNLGNCYVKAGNMGRARLCYEKARRLDPGNKEIENNLAYIASKVNDANVATAGKDKELLAQDVPSFFESVHKSVAVETSSDSWAILAAMAFALLIGAVALYIFSRNVALRKAGFFSSIAFLFFTVVFIALSFVAASEFNSDREGVVTAYRVSLLKTPEAGGKSTGPTLNQGTRLTVEEEQLDSSGEVAWYKVRLNSRVEGWISPSDYELISD